jgi:TonB-linked SusC/RagA family outer membrane protein
LTALRRRVDGIGSRCPAFSHADAETADRTVEMTRARRIVATSTIAMFSAVGALAVVATPAISQGSGTVITGRLTSQHGLPLESGDITIVELAVSARSGPDGRYTLTIPSPRVTGQAVALRARAIGYRPESRVIILAAGSQVHDFVLTWDVNRLETVMITGTAAPTAQKKLPFSATRLDTGDFPVRGLSSLQSLQGKVPGAHIVQPSGRPGAAPAIVIRGPKSINADDGGLGTTACACPLRIDGGRSQEPLLIIDGAMVNSGTQDLNPEDIESMEVIKGAAASTLYGSRAGAGVIQITTKRASRASQSLRFGIRSEYGFNDVQREYRYATRHLLLMDDSNERFCIKQAGQPLCSRTIDFEDERRRINDVFAPAALTPHAFERDYGIPVAPVKPELKGLFQVNQWPLSYNPIAQIVTSGALFNTSADLTGRSGNTSYFTSLSNLSQEGAFRFLRGFRRSSARVNLEQVLPRGASVQLNGTYGRGRLFSAIAPTGFQSYADATDEYFFSVTRAPAGADLLRRDSQGRLYIRSNPLLTGLESTNPLYAFENLDDHQDDDRFTGSLTAHYAATSWLGLDATAAADRRRTYELGYIDRDYRTPAEFGQSAGGTRGLITETTTADLSSNVMLSAKAEFTRGSDLRGSAIARYSAEQQDRQNNWARGQALAYTELMTLANAQEGIATFSARASARAIGLIGGTQIEYRDRYIFDGIVRYDGSSLFGAAERWHPYFRASAAWRLSDEPFWSLRDIASDVKLRASVGTAGGRPNMTAQYETFALSAGGIASPQTLGNKRLKPEHTLETELGLDAELVRRVGINLTYARDITSDQLLIVPAPVASGFAQQWQNAGTLDGRTWELSVRLPILARRDVSWTTQINWDRQRTYITALNTIPFGQGFGDNATNGYAFRVAAGERFGTMYGRRFATDCRELPKPFDAQCGQGKEWQRNDEGYVVWVGEGRSWRDGVTSNLWQAVRPGCVSSSGAPLATQGEVDCRAQGGTVNSPWGIRETHWGMPTVLRDSSATPVESALGNTMPDYRVTMSHTMQWRRLSFYALLDVSVGNRVFNSEKRWSYGDFMTREQDQAGATVETAKPIGYNWRGYNPPATGVGGFYVDNRASNRTVEDGSYRKLREVQIAYDLRRISGVPGTWSVALVGRNVYTWTRYTGWDPEGGYAPRSANGSPNSAAITTGGFFTYPQTRTFTVSVRGSL